MALELLAVLSTTLAFLVAVAYYLWRTGQWPFERRELLVTDPFGGRAAGLSSDLPDVDGWLVTGLGVELPYDDIEAYDALAEALKEKANSRGGPEVAALHQECVNKLMQRACSGLLATWKACKEIDRLHRMRRTNRLSQDEWERVEAEFEAFREEKTTVVEQASWLRPGWPGGWGESVFHDAHRALIRAREKMLAEGFASTDERVPPNGRLRFAPMERVACNIGRETNGTVKCATECAGVPVRPRFLLRSDHSGASSGPRA